MNATAVAVIVIVFAALILAVMAGISGYVVGRAFATDDDKKHDERLHGTLVEVRSDTVVVSQLLSFTQERAFDYRRIAEDALAYLPEGPRKDILNREFKTTDRKMMTKVIEIEDYRKDSKKG